TGLSRAAARRPLGTRDPARARLPVLRSAARGFVLRLVRFSADRLQPALGRLRGDLDLSRRESVASAEKRAIPGLQPILRRRRAQAAARVRPAVSPLPLGSLADPGLDRAVRGKRAGLEHSGAPAGKPAAPRGLPPV